MTLYACAYVHTLTNAIHFLVNAPEMAVKILKSHSKINIYDLVFNFFNLSNFFYNNIDSTKSWLKSHSELLKIYV